MRFWDHPDLNAVRADRDARFDATRANVTQQRRVERRERRRGSWRDWFSMLSDGLIGLGMYSSDPTLARQSMVYTAERELGRQREMHAQERAVDQVRRTDELDYLAARMADELEDRARRLRGY